MISYLFVILCILFLSALIYFNYVPNKNFRLIAKIATSLCFLLIAAFSYLSNFNNFNYFILIFIGLIFSFLGDIFLGIKSENTHTSKLLFLDGVVSFSITHIFYSIAFINLSGLYFKDFAIALLTCVILIFLLKLIKGMNFKGMFVPICFYVLIISFMVCKSVLLINVPSLNIVALILIICGAILFILSDFILSFVLFFKDCPKIISALNLITYYLGQILLALSILYI